MVRIYITAICVGLAVCSVRSEAAAGGGEAVRGAWEREAEARVWESALARGGLRVSASCDRRTVERIGEQRERSVRALERALLSGDGGALRGSAAVALFYGSAGVRELTGGEREEVSQAISMAAGRECGERGSPSPAGAGLARGEAAVMPAPAGAAKEGRAGAVEAGERMVRESAAGVNLREYSADGCKADYYRLYFYRQGDNPWESARGACPPPRRSRTFRRIHEYHRQYPNQSIAYIEAATHRCTIKREGAHA